jgi:hypothetical protein
MSNYAQPDYRVPTLDPRVTVQVENVLNPLSINAPVAKYTQIGGTDKPPAPLPGQLSITTALGRSRHVFASGLSVST